MYIFLTKNNDNNLTINLCPLTLTSSFTLYLTGILELFGEIYSKRNEHFVTVLINGVVYKRF